MELAVSCRCTPKTKAGCRGSAAYFRALAACGRFEVKASCCDWLGKRQDKQAAARCAGLSTELDGIAELGRFLWSSAVCLVGLG